MLYIVLDELSGINMREKHTGQFWSLR